MDPSEELVDVVDLEDRVTGVVPRSEMRAGNLVHRAAYVLVRNSRGEIYVHRRTDTKDVDPGLYDMFAAGVCTTGETYDRTAVRELGEELGIEGIVPRFLFKHLYEGAGSRLWGAVYDALWDGPIRHQESEIAWGAFVSLEELLRMLEEREFCADSRELSERWLAGKYHRPDMEDRLTAEDVDRIAKLVAGDLRTLYGDRLKQVVLFGSWARGDARDESDIDLMVVLDRVDSVWDELHAMTDLLWRRVLDDGAVVTVLPVAESDFDASARPVVAAARAEGHRVA